MSRWLWAWCVDLDVDWDTHDGDRWLVGQDEHGDWYGPTGEDRWTKLRLWKPRHLAAFLRSRHTLRAVLLESVPKAVQP